MLEKLRMDGPAGKLAILEEGVSICVEVRGSNWSYIQTRYFQILIISQILEIKLSHQSIFIPYKKERRFCYCSEEIDMILNGRS